MFDIPSIKQGISGAFVAIIIFFAIRGGNPFFFNPTIGIIISAILIWIYWNGFKMPNKSRHFFMNILISFLVCAVMANIFGLITIEELYSMKVFGSLVIVGVWVSFPIAMLFDRYNFTNPMRRYYIRGK